MKRILVTGGAGFIGSHLCEKLLSMGNEVICLDNYFTGSKKNIMHLLDNHCFEVIRHDITMPVYIEESILQLPRIAINGGRRGYLVQLDPQVCVRLLAARPVQCALAQ